MTVKEAWSLYQEAEAYAKQVEHLRFEANLRASAKLLLRKYPSLAAAFAQPRGAQAIPRPRPKPQPGPGPDPEPTPIESPNGAIVTILAWFVLEALIDLAQWASYQRVLNGLGFEILDDPQAVCTQGCHYPSPKPNPFPDLDPRIDPNPRPQPRPNPKPRARPVPTLWLPAGKYRHIPMYATMVAARRLGADPDYDRPDTDQANDWRDAMDPRKGGLMVTSYYELGMKLLGERMGCDPDRDRACRERARNRVLLPTWDRHGQWREGRVPMFSVDHIIELQLGALLPIELLDSISNWELFEFRANSSGWSSAGLEHLLRTPAVACA